MKIRSPLVLMLVVLPIAANSQNDDTTKVEFVCANTTVELQIRDSDISDVSQRKYPVESMLMVTVTRGGVRSDLTYRAGGDRAGGACATDSQGRSMIVFVAQCTSGSCGVEPAWWILEAVSGRMLLLPQEGNGQRAAEVLGSELPEIQQTISVARGNPE